MYHVLRPLWEIVIKSECDFGIDIEKLISVNTLESTVFGRQTFSKVDFARDNVILCAAEK